MCSIYDEEINSQHANDRGSSRGTSNVPSRDRSRPNTSESIRLSRIQSSGTVNSKATSNSQSNEDKQGRTRSSGTVNSKATNNSQSSQSKGEHTGIEVVRAFVHMHCFCVQTYGVLCCRNVQRLGGSIYIGLFHQIDSHQYHRAKPLVLICLLKQIVFQAMQASKLPSVSVAKVLFVPCVFL